MNLRIRVVSFSAVFLFALLANASSARGQDWRPVDPAHLAMKAPTVEPDADAEAIFWEVIVNDEDIDTVLSHYIRIKIFTERGKESESTVEIPYLGSTRIKDVFARTIKPDGSVIDMKKDAVFDKTLVKAGGLKIKAKSFAIPSVEPGVIIEYRWKEIRRSSLYMRFQLQRDIPVQAVRYLIKPGQYYSLGMRLICFNGPNVPLQKEKNGFVSATVNNVPAFREEPRMPPEDQVRRWMLIFYSQDSNIDPKRYWSETGKRFYEAFKPMIKANDEIKRASAEAIGDASLPEQKLERLFNYCRAKIKNVSDDASGVTQEAREKMKKNNNPGDTLKRGMGTWFDINILFASLAQAAGFDPRLVRVGDRSDKFFDPNFPDDYFLQTYDIAIRVGEEWRFFDPGSTYVQFGMLRWQEEGNHALITDQREPTFVQTPLSPPEKSVEKCSAKLRLSEDGTLEGDVRIEYTGHLAVLFKENNDEDSPQQREQTLIDAIKKRMATAELSDIKIENVTDPAKPFVYQFHIRVPDYAQKTGKRLFLQPAFFQKGDGPLFPTSERKHAIYFHFPWKEEDDVLIELPKGYALDNADAPGPFNVNQVGAYDVKLQSINDGQALRLQRSFFFGGGGSILFPAQSYASLKRVFDILHERDNHTITLKQTASNQ
jgi:hypothetical protein